MRKEGIKRIIKKLKRMQMLSLKLWGAINLFIFITKVREVMVNRALYLNMPPVLMSKLNR